MGLLRGEPATAEPDGQVLRIEIDIEFPADHEGQPRPGPEIGGEPVLGRHVGQPSADDLLLGVGQLGRPARGRLGDQAVLAGLPVCRDPTPHRARSDAEELGDLFDRVPLQDALDGQEATMLQLCRTSLVSHHGQCMRDKAERTLLF